MGSTLRYRRVLLIRGQDKLYRRLAESQAVSGGTLETPTAEAIEAKASAGTLDSVTAVLNVNRWLEDTLKDPANQVVTVDTRQLLKLGRLSELNYKLTDGDILYLPTPELLVEIAGCTLSGIYAMEPGETLLDLIVMCSYSNDPGADLRNLVIQRYGVDGCMERIVVNAAPTEGDAQRLAAVPLQNRDVVRVVNFVNQVFVLGQVKGPGVVDYKQDWQVLDYLTAAGGLESDAHLPFVAIVRHGRNLGRPCNATDIIPVDVRKLYQGECPDDWTIYPGDVIYVPPKGAQISLNTVSSAVNTLFLGLNFLDNLNSNDSTTTTLDKTTGK
jgi:protein involved in polysaccharide export with SLBB domain